MKKENGSNKISNEINKEEKMSKYSFYYDESEHSRKISYTTISASNYYDNFITMIVGWADGKADILQRHADFENKYANRKDRNGEIKSTTLQQKQLEHGFATVYKGNIIKNLIMDCQSYTKYRPNETTGGIFVSWRRKEELPTGA